jgi:hypothetical protein
MATQTSRVTTAHQQTQTKSAEATFRDDSTQTKTIQTSHRHTQMNSAEVTTSQQISTQTDGDSQPEQVDEGDEGAVDDSLLEACKTVNIIALFLCP